MPLSPTAFVRFILFPGFIVSWSVKEFANPAIFGSPSVIGESRCNQGEESCKHQAEEGTLAGTPFLTPAAPCQKDLFCTSVTDTNAVSLDTQHSHLTQNALCQPSVRMVLLSTKTIRRGLVLSPITMQNSGLSLLLAGHPGLISSTRHWKSSPSCSWEHQLFNLIAGDNKWLSQSEPVC